MRIISTEWFYNDNNIPYELQWKGDIECYDKVMEPRPIYPKILRYIQKVKEYLSK
jgi:hypothetical protein